MQFDFQLAPGASQTIDVKGRFFKYKEGAGLIRVRTSLGGAVDLLPGQGIENVNFTSLTIADRSGAVNAGSILAGDFDFRDDRITGSVEIIDGGRSRTLANGAFIANNVCQPSGVATQSHVQLWNPPESGKNLVLKGIIAASGTTGYIELRKQTAPMGTIPAEYNKPVSKRLDSAAIGVALLRIQQSAGTGARMFAFSITANLPVMYVFQEPIVLPPGTGFSLNADLNQGCGATFEYFEEPAAP
jgi:hypothetical protein